MTLISMNRLRKELASLYHQKTININSVHRAMERGMPYIEDPVKGRPMFDWDEVRDWVMSHSPKAVRASARAKANEVRL